MYMGSWILPSNWIMDPHTPLTYWTHWIHLLLHTWILDQLPHPLGSRIRTPHLLGSWRHGHLACLGQAEQVGRPVLLQQGQLGGGRKGDSVQGCVEGQDERVLQGDG